MQNASVFRTVAFLIYIYFIVSLNWWEKSLHYLSISIFQSAELSVVVIGASLAWWALIWVLIWRLFNQIVMKWNQFHRLETLAILACLFIGGMVGAFLTWVVSFSGLNSTQAIFRYLLISILFSFVFLYQHLKLWMTNGGLNKSEQENASDLLSAHIKLLDTSSIVDGRMIGIHRTGFLDGTLIVPDFVVHELQKIADSADVTKRNRGRYGLDLLNQLQREAPQQIRIQEVSPENGDVDHRLMKLAKRWQAPIVTNDYNLMKVCELHDIRVLNMNELANVLKTAVLPGEALHVQVLKDGKENGQGIGYLDDGTMIVVECGKHYIGQTVEVIVSSVLQTSAGKMIFSKCRDADANGKLHVC